MRAGANTAAINYYFGGIDGLYAAALEEANQRLVPVEVLSAAIAGKTDARAKLQALIELVADKLMGPISSSWALGFSVVRSQRHRPRLRPWLETQGLLTPADLRARALKVRGFATASRQFKQTFKTIVGVV